MGFKDYRKFAKKDNQNQTPEVIQNNEEVNTNETIDETIENVVTELPEVEERPVDVTTKGVVMANKLNIRKEASKEADVLTVISKGTGVGINLTKSTDEFYCVNVVVNGEFTNGYAMKEFITINE